MQTVQFFNNGSLMDPSALTLNGATITGFSIATGHVLIIYYQAV